MSSYNSSSVWRGDAEEQEVVNSNATGMQISFLGTAGTLTTRTRSPTTTFFILLLIIFIIVIIIIIISYSGSLTARTRSATGPFFSLLLLFIINVIILVFVDTVINTIACIISIICYSRD